MVWVKLDDGFGEHPKLAAAGLVAMAVFVKGLCYCNRALTDGFIPRDIASSLGPAKAIQALIRERLWAEADGGFRVHDYGEFNPSREEVLRDRAAAKARKDRWKERRSERRRNGVPEADGTAFGTRSERERNGDGTQKERRSSDAPPPYPPPPPGSLRSPRGRGGDGACAPEERRAAPGERHSKAITDAARIGIHEDRARESIASHGIEAVERANAAALACPVRTDAVDAWFDALMETAP